MGMWVQPHNDLDMYILKNLVRALPFVQQTFPFLITSVLFYLQHEIIIIHGICTIGNFLYLLKILTGTILLPIFKEPLVRFSRNSHILSITKNRPDEWIHTTTQIEHYSGPSWGYIVNICEIFLSQRQINRSFSKNQYFDSGGLKFAYTFQPLAIPTFLPSGRQYKINVIDQISIKIL